MILKAMMMLLCTAGIAFYLRFLVALRKGEQTSFEQSLGTPETRLWRGHDSCTAEAENTSDSRGMRTDRNKTLRGGQLCSRERTSCGSL
jgi:hypothetical protein